MNDTTRDTCIEALIFAYKSSIPEAKLDAALAALQQPRAEGAQWVPLADGVYDTQHAGNELKVAGEWLEVRERNIRDPDDAFIADVALLDDVRLCRRTPASPAPEVVLPARLRAALRTLVDLHAVGDESAAREVVRAWLATHHPTP